MQNQASPTPARRQFTHGTSAQTVSGSPSPIRRAPPSYDSIRQSPEKSGKVEINVYNTIRVKYLHAVSPLGDLFSYAINISREDIQVPPHILVALPQRHHLFLQ